MIAAQKKRTDVRFFDKHCLGNSVSSWRGHHLI